MTTGARTLAFAALLASALPAAGDACSDLKSARAALDTARAVRESLVPFAEVAEKAVRKFPEIQESLSSTLPQEVRAAYVKAYAGYTGATVAAHDAAVRSVAAASLSDDQAIQAALVLNGAATDMIAVAVFQVQSSKNLTKLEDFDAIIDGLLETVVAAACK